MFDTAQDRSCSSIVMSSIRISIHLYLCTVARPVVQRGVMTYQILLKYSILPFYPWSPSLNLYCEVRYTNNRSVDLIDQSWEVSEWLLFGIKTIIDRNILMLYKGFPSGVSKWWEIKVQFTVTYQAADKQKDSECNGWQVWYLIRENGGKTRNYRVRDIVPILDSPPSANDRHIDIE